MVQESIITLALLYECVYESRGNNTYIIQDRTALVGGLQIRGFILGPKQFEIDGFLQIVAKFLRFLDFARNYFRFLVHNNDIKPSSMYLQKHGLGQSLCNHRFRGTCYVIWV